MENWTEGYVADVGYTFGFYVELAPRLLSFAMLSKGVRPPALEGPFTYCELGFGQGFSINLLAAANPKGDFWGTDFNPAHAAWAQRLATDVGSKNIHLFDKSFGEFAELDTPQFDFITLHGVYSWISQENRRAIVEILRKKLKFGGVVYISYNSLPGLSTAMPLRELMIGAGTGTTEGRVKRVERAMTFAQRVADLGAVYFAANPGAGVRLTQMAGQDRSYLAHEYFNRDWNPQYHAEVARELGEAKLVFAASAHMPDHVDMLNLSPGARSLLAEIEDPTFRETIRDYFVNQHFRRDVFVKGRQALTSHEQLEILGDIPFLLTVPRSELKLQFNLGLGEAKLQSDIYNPIADALVDGVVTPNQLLERDRIRALGLTKTIEALSILVAMGQATVALDEEGRAEREASCRNFNEVVMNRARLTNELQAFASPVTGSGIAGDRFERLFSLAKRGGRDPAEFAWELMEKQGQRLTKEGKVLDKPADNLLELRSYAKTFETSKLPIWKKLGVL